MTAPTLEQRAAIAMKKSWHAKLKDWPNIEEPDIAALQRELTAQSLALVEAAQGWQSIETAPKDGYFLAYRDSTDQWEQVRRYKNPTAGEDVVINFSGRWWTTDRWSPLPAAPGEQS